MLHANLFHEFQPIWGFRPRPLLRPTARGANAAQHAQKASTALFISQYQSSFPSFFLFSFSLFSFTIMEKRIERLTLFF